MALKISKNQSRFYKVLIEQDQDGYFVASVPALPGCATQAKDLKTLNRRIREAILLCLDVVKEGSSSHQETVFV